MGIKLKNKNMKYIKYILILVLFLEFPNLIYAQDVKWSRPGFGMGYKIGITDGSTSDYFSYLHVLELNKYFNVGKPVTLFLTGSFANANSKVASNLSSAALGGGISLYPIYFTKLISGSEYEPEEDNLHVDFGFHALLNRADFDYLYAIEVNAYSFRFKNGNKLSGRIGYNLLLSDEEVNKNQSYKDLKYNTGGFFTLGINYSF